MLDGDGTPDPRLPLLDTWTTAALAVVARWRPLAAALLVPYLATLGLGRLASALNSASAVTLLGLVALVPSTLIGVCVHRVILLGPGSLPNRFGLFFTRREALYLAARLAFQLALGLVVWGVATLATGLLALPVAFVLVSYPAARLAPILPAVAVGGSDDLGDAWGLTEGRGWRLALLLGVPIALGWGLRFGPAWLLRELGVEVPSLVFSILQVPLQIPLSIWFLAVLATAWWRLTAEPEGAAAAPGPAP